MINLFVIGYPNIGNVVLQENPQLNDFTLNSEHAQSGAQHVS